MKVLIIAPYFFERHRWMISAYKTALNLSKKIDVVVLTTGKPAIERINKHLIVYRLWDIFLPDPINFSFIPGLFWGLEKVLAKEKPDIFLVNKNMFFTSLAVPWLKLRGKKVITVTDTFPGINWFPKNSLVKMVMIAYAHLVGMPILKISDKVILLHEGLIGVAKQYRLDYIVIHNGVDLDLIRSARKVKLIGKIKIGYVGRLESIKGYKILLAVAERMINHNQNVHFYFVGNLVNRQDLISQYKLNQNIHLLGHRNDVLGLLKSFDIFVLPSYSEGLPNALMEAMASSCACVASRVGGVKILIKNNINGLLFDPSNQKELEKCLIRLIDNPDLRRTLGQQAKLTIKENFNWEKITKQYLDLFRTFKN